MARETITDYKTVEKQREVTICDQCGRTDDDEGCTIIDIAINPKIETETEIEYDVFEIYEEQKEAWDKYHEDVFPIIGNGDTTTQHALGDRKYTRFVKAEASATADMCQECLSKLLDVGLEDNQEINDVEIYDGGIDFIVTENVVKNYPTPTIPPFGIKSIVFIAFAIVVFPITLFLILFANEEWEKNDISHKEIFIIATLGTFLWSILLLFVINPTLFLTLF